MGVLGARVRRRREDHRRRAARRCVRSPRDTAKRRRLQLSGHGVGWRRASRLLLFLTRREDVDLPGSLEMKRSIVSFLVALGAFTHAADQPQWGQAWSRNMVSAERGLPSDFDP